MGSPRLNVTSGTAKGPYGAPSVSAPEPAIVDAFVERFVIEARADGPLRGVSFVVKDVFDVAGWPTRCGNPTWAATHSAAHSTAPVVETLLRAGARLVGKTRTDELAYSLDGRNFHEGAPLNPAAPERLTGGSSSGAASAVAARQAEFAIAADTAGSVRVPAAWCGLIGMRPTHGRLSVAGLTPLAPSFDTVGWLGRSISLMRTIGAVLFEERHRDVTEVALTHDLGVQRRAGGIGFEQAISCWETPARPVSEVSLDIDLDAAADCLRVLQANEIWATHGRWIESARPRFGPGIAERFEGTRAIGVAELREAARERAAIAARVESVLPPGRILCLPTVHGPAPHRDSSPEQLQRVRAQLLPLTALASLTGRPQITWPMNPVEGAPVGISLLGWINGDESLLETAQLLSAAS
jgi:amidase